MGGAPRLVVSSLVVGGVLVLGACRGGDPGQGASLSRPATPTTTMAPTGGSTEPTTTPTTAPPAEAAPATTTTLPVPVIDPSRIVIDPNGMPAPPNAPVPPIPTPVPPSLPNFPLATR